MLAMQPLRRISLERMIRRKQMRALQETGCKYSGYPEFLPQRHLQTRDRDYGYDQDGEIGYHVDCAARNENHLIVETATWYPGIPKFASRNARPNLNRHVREVEEKVQPNGCVDEPVSFGSAAGDEDSKE